MTPTGAWSANNLTSLFGCQKASGDPYGYVRPDGISEIVYKGTDSHVREMNLDGTWSCNDLTGATGAPDVGSVGPTRSSALASTPRRVPQRGRARSRPAAQRPVDVNRSDAGRRRTEQSPATPRRQFGAL